MVCSAIVENYEKGVVWINAKKKERRCIGQTSRAESSLDGSTPPRAINRIGGNWGPGRRMSGGNENLRILPGEGESVGRLAPVESPWMMDMERRHCVDGRVPRFGEL